MATHTPTPNIHAQKKRKAEDDARPGTKRPTQRRASAACRSCRARKVRCDVLLKSTPCTNCRLDGAECIIADSKRTKFARTADGTTLLIGNSQKDASNKDWNAAAIVTPNNDLINAGRGSVERSNEYDSSDSELQQRSASDPIIAHDMMLSNMFSVMHQLFGPAPEAMHKQPDIDLPRFIKQHFMELESDDFNYLHKKGAFEIPHFAFRNELLKSYVNYVHVYMPFLDLEDFLQTIYENTGRKRISLLLFQAVMFAGTAFVNIKHLRMAGYQSRRAARKAFFQRVRALYDLDYEEDQIIVIQALMLMSYWFETPHDQKDCFHWIGISLALSRLNGMHLDITTAAMDPNTRRIWRRTWWILYSRDKTIPLGMRRPARLREDDYDLDMISLDDFELRPLPTHLRQMIGASETLSNPSYQRVLALLFIEMVKLCGHLHQALALQYRTPVHDVKTMRGARMALIPKTEATDIAQIRYHDEGLEKWFANTPKETRYSPQFACELSEGDEVLHLHRSMLKLLYLATRSTLHLPQIIRALPNKLQPSELHQESLEKVRYTAAEITAIAQDLHHLNLTRYLPSNGATPLLSAIATHVIDLTSSGSAIKLNSLNSLHQCLQTILRLREIYPVTDSITDSIEKIMRDMGLQKHLHQQQQQQQQQYSRNPLTTSTMATLVTQGQAGGEGTTPSDCYDLASAGMDCYGPTSSPKACPPSLKFLDSMVSHPRVREVSSSVSSSASENGGEAGTWSGDVSGGKDGRTGEHRNEMGVKTEIEDRSADGNGKGCGNGDDTSTPGSSHSNPNNHVHDTTSTNVCGFAVDHIAQLPLQNPVEPDICTGAVAGAVAATEPEPTLHELSNTLLSQDMEEQSIETMLKEFTGNYSIFEMGYTMGEEVGVDIDSLPINIDDGGLLNGSNGGVERKADDVVVANGGGPEQTIRLSV